MIRAHHRADEFHPPLIGKRIHRILGMIPPLPAKIPFMYIYRDRFIAHLRITQKSAAVVTVIMAECNGIQFGQINAQLPGIFHKQPGFAHIINHAEAVLFHIDG